jgi:hypothetical protein
MHTCAMSQHDNAIRVCSCAGDAEAGAQDNELPSVMTCANYIKLPQYSSQEVCMRQVRLAITEGQGSFDLS